jgi:hypothetical protein
MKVCPVCQYEEEQDDEVSCAICGSDLESEGAIVEETTSEIVPVVGQTEDTKIDEIVPSPSEVSSMTDEEKEIEEALSASEVPSLDKSDSSNSFSEILSTVKDSFGDFLGKLDGFFKTDSKINYVAPGEQF